MAGAPTDIAPSPWVELGRKGAEVRWHPDRVEQSAEQSALGGRKAQINRLLTISRQLEENGLFSFKKRKIEDPEAYIADMWARSLPHEWEQLLDVAKLARDWDLVQRILTAMTAMTPALSPLKLRQIAQSAANDLPGDMADLSAADDEMLAKLTGKRVGKHVNAVEGSMPRQRGRKRDGGREPAREVGPDLVPDTPTKKISSKSKKKAKQK